VNLVRGQSPLDPDPGTVPDSYEYRRYHCNAKRRTDRQKFDFP
jgi:hypothetical protein